MKANLLRLKPWAKFAVPLLLLNTTWCAFAAGGSDSDMGVDLSLGKALYLAPGKGGCATCHGTTGGEPIIDFYPKIAGQSEKYLFNQMMDYQQKRRKNGLFVPMEVAMQPYTEQEIALIAQFLASQ
ncbi:c-type cytochrome [Vibrio sp. SM6]|uniref:C-type cytochrome n=1 Tax=Vibrio agarilyticus TaxID=2726741 RepID=A0A7X8YGL4_9VIBR|nr:c-type cytochrome [Vibrio agarilyticus]NLS12502.1 c-type cytochrome [Vibrio agarilyticus]